MAGQKTPKRPRDLNQWAKHMFDLATGAAQEPAAPAKNHAAAGLGRKGGQKGGLSQNMTKARRSASAKRAAQARGVKILAPLVKSCPTLALVGLR